jgi:Fic family protein
MTADRTDPWRPIDAVPDINGSVTPLLATVDSLRSAWKEAMSSSTTAEREAARDRRLRRHAVETGIIERLYELDWGTTEMLVAEGLTAEAANRAEGISADTLETIRSQYDALAYLVLLVNEGQDLTVLVIRDLHKIITRNQPTYEARDQFGKTFQRPLTHGQWKQQPNHVRRLDGRLLEYAPPEQVQSELERLIALHNEAADAHPLVRSAWLHHRFIQIHPFEDGNGRVARALTLLILLRDHYAPLVVDRRERESYIQALDAANDGDLAHLVRLFARLEIVALQSTLTQPITVSRGDGRPSTVVQSYVRRLLDLQTTETSVRRRAAERLAVEVHAAIVGYLDEQARLVEQSLRELDPFARAWIRHAKPPEEHAGYYRRQIIAAANRVDFYTNLGDGSWWVRLQVDARGERLRYLGIVQKVGHGDSGVLAVTAYAELVRPEDEASVAVEPQPALELNPTDSVTLAYTDVLTERHAEIEEFLRDTLSRALERFLSRLG